jgi:predicted  nucleic acid-binding Zn-ribbon protein
MGTHNDTVAPEEREDVARRYRELLSAYKTLNAEVADLAWALADLEQEIATLAAATGAAGARARQRLRDLRRQRDALDEQALRQMDQAETIAAELARLRRALDEVGAPVVGGRG